ncbi:hypothetical protein L6452_30173 [Arctium lappa]|uniref:Uncharacterized protein n=1 Tax=Arctium lappa TaxID=4217 RepID=A0ACB8ZJ37_ARCLA|nr:hypothetical protein L6452_30173 [Arctium lappa]
MITKMFIIVPNLTSLRTRGFVVQAAWTRRSRSEAEKRPNKKSWKQRTDMYMRPFQLNVFFSKRFVHAKVMHRGTSKVISVATTNSKDLRNTLPSLIDNEACRVIGRLIAERSKEADVFAMVFEAKKNERVEGRLAIVLDTIKDNVTAPVFEINPCLYVVELRKTSGGSSVYRQFETLCIKGLGRHPPLQED